MNFEEYQIIMELIWAGIIQRNSNILFLRSGGGWTMRRHR
jgi:hypothetical protein